MPESVRRIWAMEERTLALDFEGITEIWKPIDQATVNSGLIPRFQDVFTSVGLAPLYLIYSFDFYPGTTPRSTRCVMLICQEIDFIPGFVVSKFPEKFLQFHLLTDFDPQWTNLPLKMKENNETIGNEERFPYWWPRIETANYPQNAYDVTDHVRMAQAERETRDPLTYAYTSRYNAPLLVSPDQDFQSAFLEYSKLLDQYFEEVRRIVSTPRP